MGCKGTCHVFQGNLTIHQHSVLYDAVENDLDAAGRSRPKRLKELAPFFGRERVISMYLHSWGEGVGDGLPYFYT